MASGAVSTGKSAWSQLDGLLTCAICLDRYRNPKLLPCQHTFCMEPCLEGLIDYVRRQIKCPECRAEHRIPYQGIQGYPTNVTLMRFLELHFAVTGEEPDTSPTVMERCAVCSEKSYLTHCGHCDKKACAECKEAHLDILKREISRINNQVRRGLHRLQEALDQADKTSQQFQTNCTRVLDDIGDTSRRLQKAVKDREESLRSQVQNFLQNELKTATQMKEGLETEVSNIQSNCELIETHVTENSDWEDVELVDYKEIFLKTIEFLRSFDPETSDFNRRLKFTMGPGDPDALHHSVANFGDLTINATQFGSTATPLGQGVGGVIGGGGGGGGGGGIGSGSGSTGGGMLMRSKSDHRLASQFQRNEEIRMSSSYLGLAAQRENDSRDGRTSPLSSRRRAAEYGGDSGPGSRRGAREADDAERGSYGSGRRYNYTSDARNNKDRDREDADGGYRSRFTGEILRDSSDSDLHSSRSVRFARQTEQEPASVTAAPPRERVFETEDATRGPLSGIARLMDSPRVMERLQQNEQRKKLKEIKKDQQPPPPPAPAPQQQTQAALPSRPRAGRQVSEDDEIAKIKAQNKGQETVAVAAAAAAAATSVTVASATTTTTTTTAPQPLPLAESATRPVTRRVAALQSREDNPRGVGKRSGGDERPPSREGSGDGYESASSRPPSRQSTASDTKDAGKSASDRQAGEEEGKTTQLRRTYGRSGGADHASSKVHAGKSSAITETASESDSDAKTSREGSNNSSSSSSSSPGGSDTGVPLNAADDANGQEKPNYFRFRTAAYSRTPSNSSVNLNSPDSPDESPLSPPIGRPPAIDAVKSTDSSSAGSPEASPRRVAPPAGAREDRKPESPDPAPRRTTEDSRVPGTQGRSSSLDKSDVTFERPKPRFTSRFLPRTSSLKESDDVPRGARNPHPVDSDTESSCSDSDDDNKAKDSRVGGGGGGGGTPRHSVSSVTMSTRSATDADVTAILTRSALARKENAAHVSRDRDRQESSSASAYSRLYGRDRDQDSSKAAGRRTSSRYDAAADAGASEGRYSSLASRYSTRSKNAIPDDDEIGSRYGRYLSRSKSSATLGVEEASSGGGGGSGGGGIGADRYGKKDYGGSSRYAGGGSAAASLRRSRLARSRSSHDIHPDDEDEDRHDDDDEPSLPSYRSGRFERPSDYSLSRSRSHHALSSPRDSPREQSPDDTGRGGDSSGLSPWARYLRNKYGSRSRENSKDGGTATTTAANSGRSIGRSRTASNLYSREASSESSDDERGGGGTSHDSSSRRDSPAVSHSSGYAGLNSPRSAYAQKRRLVMKIGSRGSEPGCFTWPRGIAVGPENSVVVADSSNHRVQVFDHQGGFCKEFGCYGSAEGEFDCLAGVAVNRIGQFIVSDRYNHRIQVFDPSGRFLRSFGSQGTGDGRLSYPWGIATDSLGFIYVCDKENHRVQVFQSDGTFVGKFGTLGSKTGQLEHPHYVAVSNTNKVVVSDSNNHRIQVFDVNGRVLSSFGSEGSDDGQFKFPRGVAVDDQGYIVVGDSGNNRIQIFNPDGSFLKAFGTWGSADGEFKGLEGIAVASNGNILVCDRENHRIQVF